MKDSTGSVHCICLNSFKVFAIAAFAMLLMIGITVFTPKAAYASTNIVLNKPSISLPSKSVLPFVSGRAVDGITNQNYSRWYSAEGSGQRGIQVDLQGLYAVNHWNVYHLSPSDGWDNSSITKDFNLQGSLDGTNWFTLDSVSGNTSAVTSRDCARRLVRYVKIVITQGNQLNNNWTSIQEFQVMGDPASQNAKLSSISISDGTLNPVFEAGTYAYNANVPNSTDGITVTPTLSDSKATMTINNVPVNNGQPLGNIPLSVGNNTIFVNVTAEDGTTKNLYTVTVIREQRVIETLSVSNPSLTGFTAALSPALPGLTASDFVLANTSGQNVTISSAVSTDNGSTYQVSAPLAPGTNYTLTVKAGYDFTSPVNIVDTWDLALGDSITYGMSAQPGKGYADLYAVNLKSDSANGNVAYVNLAVPGETSTTFLAKLQTPDYAQKLAGAKEITLSIGGNNLLGPVIQSVCSAFGVDSNSPDKMNLLAAAMAADPAKTANILNTLAADPALAAALQNGAVQFGADFPGIIMGIKQAAPQANLCVLSVYNPFKPQDLVYGSIQPLVKMMNQLILDSQTALGYKAVDLDLLFDHTDGAVDFDLTALKLDPHPTTIGHDAIYRVMIGEITNTVWTPPVLTPDAAKTVGSEVIITFTDNANWRKNIRDIVIGGSTVLNRSQYTVTGGKITINAGVLTTPGNQTITVVAAGYDAATVTQSITSGIPQPTFTLTVNNGEGSGTFKGGDMATVTATVPAGKTFGGWKDEGGNILTYSETYSFIVTRSMTLTAEIVDSPVTAVPKTTLDNNVIYLTDDPTYVTMKVLGTFITPAGYTVVDQGFISLKNPPVDPGTDLTLATVGITKLSTLNKTNESGQVYRSIKTYYDYTFYVRGYLTYKDAAGNTQTIYSEYVVKAVKSK